jgi:uncharacterized protein (DUF362 family)
LKGENTVTTKIIKKLSPSPFIKDKGKPEVWVTSGQGAYANTTAALANIDLSPARGKRVLLKPNAGRLAAPGAAVTTDPQVVAAAIDAFKAVGAEVAIGESPISGINTLEAFEVTGIAAVAKARNCPLIDMDVNRPVQVTVPDGIAIDHLFVCPEIFEYDIIVSIPVMKMHMHTGVTLAVKNMKGGLWRRTKVQLHMLPPVTGYDEKPINIAIADMSDILRPHLSIIDGTVGMEGLGPSAGETKPLGIVVVGTDPFATDAVACRLMSTKAEKIPHLYLAAARDYGVIDLAKITVHPENWQDLAVQFAEPPSNMAINFPNITVLDKNSCSACQSTLLLFLKRYGEKIFDYFETENINIAIGKGHKKIPLGTLCIGNCTARHRDRGIYVKGCPPVSSEILCVLSAKPSFDTKDGGN